MIATLGTLLAISGCSGAPADEALPRGERGGSCGALSAATMHEIAHDTTVYATGQLGPATRREVEVVRCSIDDPLTRPTDYLLSVTDARSTQDTQRLHANLTRDFNQALCDANKRTVAGTTRYCAGNDDSWASRVFQDRLIRFTWRTGPNAVTPELVASLLDEANRNIAAMD